ncbi:contact-dependent growth inhibition system immunity protein [Pseudomonas sp. R3-18-08]|uniref:contact-dependent growth inhibition system immunity protein n=1 Tax=Pseudomonas sp. R3-18-08 TaxID=1173283 RepID=UPI000F563094|nr:contact-dependent growth inhibition system immunity protein [Pseudomonas sp. R3-18-08]AZF15401.1 hypothetical protein C4J92_1916 [Pseudomonas sp. R3-18-08]
MDTTPTELQQFFGAYFNQDWVDDHACADDVIDTFLMDSSTDIICTVRKEILELINAYTNESELLENLLHEQYCYYYYPNEWASGPLWLHHIIEKFDSYLLKE